MPARMGERKRQLLTQARALIAVRGFTAATCTVLAKAAGLTTLQLARTFPDNASLLRAVLDDLREETFPAPDSLPDLPHDPAGQLLGWLERVRVLASRRTEGSRLLVRAVLELTDPDARAEVLARMLEWSEPLSRLLQAGQQAGVVRRSLDAPAAAWDIMQSILGFTLIGPHLPVHGGAASPFDSLLHGVMKVDV